MIKYDRRKCVKLKFIWSEKWNEHGSLAIGWFVRANPFFSHAFAEKWIHRKLKCEWVLFLSLSLSFNFSVSVPLVLQKFNLNIGQCVHIVNRLDLSKSNWRKSVSCTKCQMLCTRFGVCRRRRISSNFWSKSLKTRENGSDQGVKMCVCV